MIDVMLIICAAMLLLLADADATPLDTPPHAAYAIRRHCHADADFAVDIDTLICRRFR